MTVLLFTKWPKIWSFLTNQECSLDKAKLGLQILNSLPEKGYYFLRKEENQVHSNVADHVQGMSYHWFGLCQEACYNIRQNQSNCDGDVGSEKYRVYLALFHWQALLCSSNCFSYQPTWLLFKSDVLSRSVNFETDLKQILKQFWNSLWN